MNEFELRRLRQKGKDVILPGGRCALEVLEERMFEEADERLDKHFKKKRDEKEKHSNTTPKGR